MIASMFRAHRVLRVLVQHGLDDLLSDTPLAKMRWLLVPFSLGRMHKDRPRGERLRLALQALGPIFVKFGQILSTRRDLIPADFADELAILQDQVAPFDGALARARIQAGLGKPIAQLFAEFSETPLASASVAQVHPARILNADGSIGRDVVVKVLRPGIRRQIRADIELLRSLAGVVDRHHPAADKIRAQELVDEIENTLKAELDLQREGANASYMQRHWSDGDELLIPDVIWSHTCETILTLERVHGTPTDDLEAIAAAGISRKALAEAAVRVFYLQVFRDNFFHADAHAGNIWFDPKRKDKPRFIVLDFGIVGQLQERDQYYLAENFMAMFARDYRRIAELHVEAGWMPAHIRLENLEAAIRGVCEPYFTRPLSEVPLGEVLVKIFRTAQDYELTIQPQLILLQKTLLNVEGMARHLDPQIDIWAVAQPVLESILAKRYSAGRLFDQFKKRLPALISKAPEMPQLLHAWLSTQVEGRQKLEMHSTELADIHRAIGRASRKVFFTLGGSALLICGAVFWGLDVGAMHWFGIPASAWTSGVLALLCFAIAWPRGNKP